MPLQMSHPKRQPGLLHLCHGPNVCETIGDARYNDFAPHLIKTNVEGRRDSRQYLQQKPGGVIRVAFLGDSFAEASEVPEPFTAARKLEAGLSEKLGTQYKS